MSYSCAEEVLIRASRADVWDAITRPELVKAYFFDTDLVTDWTVGSPLFFRGEWEGKTYEDRGTVLSFVPGRSLSYDYWTSFSGHEDTPDRRQIIRFDLDETADGVRVAVQQSNVDSQERADHSAANWRMVLAAMKELVEQRVASSLAPKS